MGAADDEFCTVGMTGGLKLPGSAAWVDSSTVGRVSPGYTAAQAAFAALIAAGVDHATARAQIAATLGEVMP